MCRLPPLVMALMLPVTVAHGQPAAVPGRNSPAYAACLDRSGGVTPAMVACSGEETARWDRRLNAAYSSLMGNPAWSAETKAMLREAQRAWIAFRDRTCTAQGELEAEGGTLARIVTADCIARRTAERASELEQIVREAARR